MSAYEHTHRQGWTWKAEAIPLQLAIVTCPDGVHINSILSGEKQKCKPIVSYNHETLFCQGASQFIADNKVG